MVQNILRMEDVKIVLSTYIRSHYLSFFLIYFKSIMNKRFEKIENHKSKIYRIKIDISMIRLNQISNNKTQRYNYDYRIKNQ